MGWDYQFDWDTKEKIVNYLTAHSARDNRTQTCLDQCTVGNTLWAAFEVTTAGKTEREVVCFFLRYDRGDRCWGYKAISEASYPYDFTCPKRILDLAPEPADAHKDEQGKTWRQRWTEVNAQRKVQRNVLRQKRNKIEVGQTWKLRDGCNPQQVRITGVYPIMGEHDGRIYRVAPRFLDMQI